MRHFATESGKSKGQFYTPAEVSRIMAKVVGIGAQHPPGPDRLRPDLWLGLAAAQGRRRGAHAASPSTARRRTTPPGRLAKMNMILHGNDDADIRKGDTHHQPAVHEGRRAQDLRLRRRQSAVLGQVVEQRARRTTTAASSSACRRRRTATTPSCSTSSSRSRAPARRAVILPHGVLFRGNAEADIRKAAHPARLHQGHHRPAGQPLLRHRHPGLHRRARQGERAGPHRHLHDRRLQGLHEGRQQEPPPRPGHPQDRRRLQQADRDRRATRAWCRSPRSPAQPTTTTSTSRATSTPPSRRTSRTSTPTCTAASPTATSTRSATTGTRSRQLRVEPVQAEPPRLQRPCHRRRSGAADDPRLRGVPGVRAERAETVSSAGSPPIGRRLEAIDREHQAERADRRHSARTSSLRFRPVPLLDEYDVYEQLMNYWHETMHDDVFLIMNDGWVERRQAAQDHRRQGAQAHRDAGPRHRRWAQRQQVQDRPHPARPHRRALLRRRAGAGRRTDRQALRKRLAPSRSTSKSTPSKTGSWPKPWTTTRSARSLVTARLRTPRPSGADPDEIEALQHAIALYDAEAAAKKAVKDAQAALDLATLKKYGTLDRERCPTARVGRQVGSGGHRASRRRSRLR